MENQQVKMTMREINDRNAVCISDITADGFWIYIFNKKQYISRKMYPWFRDASDDEIRDVSFLPEAGDGHVNMLFWHKLGIDFDEESFASPELMYHNTYVRGVARPDLFAL